MVTDTMTWRELSDEICKDFKESHIRERWAMKTKMNTRKFQAALLAGKTKIYKPEAVKSKRGNTFYATTIIRKSEFSRMCDFDYQFAVPLHYKGQLWTGMMAIDEKGENICSFFSHHLFNRYDERFNQKDESHE